MTKNTNLVMSVALTALFMTACNNYKFEPTQPLTASNDLLSTGPDDIQDVNPPVTPPGVVNPPVIPPTTPPVAPPVTPSEPPVTPPVNPPVTPPTVTPPANQKVTENYSIPVEKPQADILLIIDTSGSMDRNLEKMATRFQSLISKWNGIDWQLAIINPAVNPWDTWSMMGYLMPLEGKASEPRTILKKSDPSAQHIFEKSVGRSTDENCASAPPWCMSASPEPLKTILKVMEKRTEENNRDFFRKGSFFVPIILSDSDEKENGGAGATQPSTVIAEYKKNFGDSMKPMVGFSIVVPPGDTACYKEENNLFKSGLGAHYGVINSEFAKQSGGFSMSICEKDYAKSLGKISEYLRVLIDQFTLKNLPLPGTLKVKLTPAQPQITWKLEGQKLIFNQALASGTEVQVSYEVKNSSAK